MERLKAESFAATGRKAKDFLVGKGLRSYLRRPPMRARWKRFLEDPLAEEFSKATCTRRASPGDGRERPRLLFVQTSPAAEPFPANALV